MASSAAPTTALQHHDGRERDLERRQPAAGSYTVTATPTAASGFDTLTDSIDDGSLNAADPVVVATTSGVDRADVDFGFVAPARSATASGSTRTGTACRTPASRASPASSSPSPGPAATVRFGDGDDIVIFTLTFFDGSYRYFTLPAGDYSVSVSTSGTNLVPTYDLDGIITPNAAATTLTAGQGRADLDFGLLGNASVGDRIWIDQDGDGVQDASEPGIPGATVRLTASGFDGVLGTADDLTFTTTTGSNGLYLFTGLPVVRRQRLLPRHGDRAARRRAIADGGPRQRRRTGDGTATFAVTDSGANQNRRDVDFGYDGLSTLAGNRVPRPQQQRRPGRRRGGHRRRDGDAQRRRSVQQPVLGPGNRPALTRPSPNAGGKLRVRGPCCGDVFASASRSRRRTATAATRKARLSAAAPVTTSSAASSSRPTRPASGTTSANSAPPSRAPSFRDDDPRRGHRPHGAAPARRDGAAVRRATSSSA